MLKKKYLHRRTRNTRLDRTWDIKKYHRGKNLDLFSDKLPQHQSIRKQYNWNSFDVTPIKEFIISKIGEPWNDIYSEIISKTKKKYRWSVDGFLYSCEEEILIGAKMLFRREKLRQIKEQIEKEEKENQEFSS